MQTSKNAKVLVIRFSSMGDIVQCFFALPYLQSIAKDTELHWITRNDFFELVSLHPLLNKTWNLNREPGFFGGLIGLIRLGLELRTQNYTHIYDAHSNVRSHILSFILKPSHIFGFNKTFIRRSKNRIKRFLLFKFRIDLFPLPQSMASTYIKPILSWVDLKSLQSVEVSNYKSFNAPKAIGPQLRDNLYKFMDSILLVPSASAELKRWPIDHWKNLILAMPQSQFVVVGGPSDTFCEEIKNVAPQRVQNVTGQLSWAQSAWLAGQAKTVVSNDTELGHLADYLGKRTFMFIGPVPFGYPHRSSTQVLEQTLPCKPCSKHGFDPCKNKELKKCLVDITPQSVAKIVGAN